MNLLPNLRKLKHYSFFETFVLYAIPFFAFPQLPTKVTTVLILGAAGGLIFLCFQITQTTKQLS